MNGNEIVVYTYRLADAVGALLDAGGFPVVLGGDLLADLLADALSTTPFRGPS